MIIEVRREISMDMKGMKVLTGTDIGKIYPEINSIRLQELAIWAADEMRYGIKELFLEDAADEISGWHAGMELDEARGIACLIWDSQNEQEDGN